MEKSLFISRFMNYYGIDQEAAEYIKEKFPTSAFHILGYCEDAFEDRLKECYRKIV